MNQISTIFMGIILFFFSASFASADCVSGMTTNNEISQYGITWTFDQNYECGQFVNGDYWILDPGSGVNIIQIDPESTQISGRYVHGSMLNPPGGLNDGGFDSYEGIYNPSLNVASDISEQNPLEINGDNSLISVVSDLTTPSRDDFIESRAVITILSQTPPDDAFRPAACGDDKTIYRYSSLDLNFLQSVSFSSVPQENRPSWEEIEENVKYPFLDYSSSWVRRQIYGQGNMYSYGRETSQHAGVISLALLSPGTIEEKNASLIGFIQRGIDLYHIYTDSVEGGRGTPWDPNGGHHGGRKAPILFAGKLLQNNDMLNVGYDSLQRNDPFHEDGQTEYIDQARVDSMQSSFTQNMLQRVQSGNPSAWSQFQSDYPGLAAIAGTGTWQTDDRDFEFHPYNQSHIGMPEWHGRGEMAREGNNIWNRYYRHVSAITWHGQALAMLAMGLKDEWAGDAFFDYVHRHVTIARTGVDPFHQYLDYPIALGTSAGSTSWSRDWNGGDIGPWVDSMWDEYWDDYYSMDPWISQFADVQTTTSITQYGITWTFSEPVEYGQFVNGDYWVVGPVEIVDIEPEFDGEHHGWMVNYDGGSQGFESRSVGFDSSLVPNLPYIANSGDSIIKSVGLEPLEDNFRPPIKTMVVLTVLGSVPENNGANVFRPSLFGNDRTIHTIDEINSSLIPSFSAPLGSNPPSFNWVVNRFKMMQLDIDSCCSSENLRAVDNFCLGEWSHACSYGGSISNANTDATLRLMLDDSYEDKEQALIYYLQFGLDLYYQFNQGVRWHPNGGHGSGRKLPIIFTGVVLENDDIKNAVLSIDKQAGDSSIFQEDGFLTATDQGYAIFGSGGNYWNNIITDYDSRTSIDPYGYIDGSHIPGTSYQIMNSMMWKGMVVAMNLMPEIKIIWDNPLFENYTIRWVNHGAWSQPDPCAPAMGYCIGGDNEGEICTYADTSVCGTGYCGAGACPSGSPYAGNSCGSNWDECNLNQGDNYRCDYRLGDFWQVTFGPDPNSPGDCILDTDPSDGIGRFPSEHGLRADEGGYQSGFANAMWDEYITDYRCFYIDYDQDADASIYDCSGVTVDCSLVFSCDDYPNQRAIGYDPCNIGDCEGSIEDPTPCGSTDTSCGYTPNCVNCNTFDGCYSTEYRDYSCSGDDTGCTYSIVPDQGCDCVTSNSDDWQNFNIEEQADSFTFTATLTPQSDNMDGVIGLSDGSISGYSELSAILRFNESGYLDAYDSSVSWYKSDSLVSYSQGSSYEIKIVVDFSLETYDAYVTPEGSSEIQIAYDYSFRASSSSIDNWALYSYIDSMEVCNAGVVSSNYHEADTNTNSIIEITELNSYVYQWKTSSSINLAQLIEAIELWKNG
ncbi:MAG: hypothetical protein ACLFPQ_02575 [Candidatus Woesearchaeota archaeon]